MRTGCSFGRIMGCLLLILLSACSLPTVGATPNGEGHTTTIPVVESPSAALAGDQNWVVFDEGQAEEMGMASWLVQSDGFWTPSNEDVLNLEAGIDAYLRQNSGAFYREPPVWERLDEYRRQYFGFKIGGKRFIYGNYFCNDVRMDWRGDFVMVLDGGDCYFQVEYDVEEGSFIQLMVNGES